MCAWMCVSVDIIIPQQYMVAFVNVVMKRFSYNTGYLMAN